MSSNDDDWVPGTYRHRKPAPPRSSGGDAWPGSDGGAGDPFGPPDQTGPLAAPYLPPGRGVAGPPDLSGPLGPLEMSGPLAEYGLSDFAAPGPRAPGDASYPPSPAGPGGRRGAPGPGRDLPGDRYEPRASGPDWPETRSRPPWDGDPLDTRTPWEPFMSRGADALPRGSGDRPAAGLSGPGDQDDAAGPGRRGPRPGGPAGPGRGDDGPDRYRPSMLNLGGYQPAGPASSTGAGRPDASLNGWDPAGPPRSGPGYRDGVNGSAPGSSGPARGSRAPGVPRQPGGSGPGGGPGSHSGPASGRNGFAPWAGEPAPGRNGSGPGRNGSAPGGNGFAPGGNEIGRAHV